MNNQAALHTFNNLGYLLTKVPENILLELKKEVDKTKKDFTKATPYNQNLVGNLQYEFLIDDNSDFNKYILDTVAVYESNFKYLDTINIMPKDLKLRVQQPWVNFMKKHEFNPPHNHIGVYSYVIWLDIPYDIEDEKNTPSSSNSNLNVPGHFGFIFTNVLGQISVTHLPVDKTWNGIMCLFPASLDHYVNPFSTSDEYRITIAGNVLFDIKQEKEEND